MSSYVSGCPQCSPYVCFSPALNLELQLMICCKNNPGGADAAEIYRRQLVRLQVLVQELNEANRDRQRERQIERGVVLVKVR